MIYGVYIVDTIQSRLSQTRFRKETLPMRKTLALVLVLALSILPAALGGFAAASDDYSGLKVAAIFGGAINDGNWNETQYNGLMAIAEMGAETDYMENVADADVAEAARTYASQGYNLIYLTTNSYQDHCTPVAEEFPDSMFIGINGTYISDNYISVRIADEQQGFMQGVIAALLCQSGKVGFVGGMEINPIKLGASGFRQGVAYANENLGTDVEALVNITGSFTDVNQAKETAIAQIEGGCTVVTPMANDASVGVMEAAEEKGAMAIGCGPGQESSAPTMTQVIVVKDVAIAITTTFESFASGALSATEVETYGANRGVVYVTDWLSDDVSDFAEAAVKEVLAELSAGNIEIDLNV